MNSVPSNIAVVSARSMYDRVVLERFVKSPEIGPDAQMGPDAQTNQQIITLSYR